MTMTRARMPIFYAVVTKETGVVAYVGFSSDSIEGIKRANEDRYFFVAVITREEYRWRMDYRRNHEDHGLHGAYANRVKAR